MNDSLVTVHKLRQKYPGRCPIVCTTKDSEMKTQCDPPPYDNTHDQCTAEPCPRSHACAAPPPRRVPGGPEKGLGAA